eukprot:5917624-Pleurochrysis_carterae.AAC.1
MQAVSATIPVLPTCAPPSSGARRVASNRTRPQRLAPAAACLPGPLLPHELREKLDRLHNRLFRPQILQGPVPFFNGLRGLP